MNLIIKHFNELTTKELYEILKARAEIFVVEQNCAYQDLDDHDYDCLHVFYEEDGKVQACLRAYEEKDTPGLVKLGRVLTLKHGTGLGGQLLKNGVAAVQEYFQPKQIYIHAQSYAAGYYAKEGFIVDSEEFMEDDIPHVKMIRDF